MIYQIRKDQLDSKPFLIEAKNQLEALRKFMDLIHVGDWENIEIKALGKLEK